MTSRSDPVASSRPERTHRRVAVVLAAGSATRFGATKQTVEVGGRPMVAHVVAAAHAAPVDQVLLVVGHDAEAVAAAARTAGPVTVVANDAHRDGQSTSFAAGLAAAATTDADVAVVLLADEPDVAPSAVRGVADAVGGKVTAARARYDDGPGHPVAFARSVWPRLGQVTGDRGARDLLADLDVVEVATGGRRPRDVDTPDDLARRGDGAAPTRGTGHDAG